MKRQDKHCDMSYFDKVTFEDYDINDVIDYVGYDDMSYAKLDMVVIPKVYRMFNYCDMSSCQKMLSSLKEEYSDEMLEDIGVGNKLYVEQAINGLSITKALKLPAKDKEFKIDDWKIYSHLDEERVKQQMTEGQKTDSKFMAFSEVMSAFDSLRFSKSAVQNVKESLEFSLHDFLVDAIDNGDVMAVRGLHYAEEYIRKILMRRNFSDNTWTMFRFAYDIDNRSYSEDAFDILNR